MYFVYFRFFLNWFPILCNVDGCRQQTFVEFAESLSGLLAEASTFGFAQRNALEQAYLIQQKNAKASKICLIVCSRGHGRRITDSNTTRECEGKQCFA